MRFQGAVDPSINRRCSGVGVIGCHVIPIAFGSVKCQLLHCAALSGRRWKC